MIVLDILVAVALAAVFLAISAVLAVLAAEQLDLTEELKAWIILKLFRKKGGK